MSFLESFTLPEVSVSCFPADVFAIISPLHQTIDMYCSQFRRVWRLIYTVTLRYKQHILFKYSMYIYIGYAKIYVCDPKNYYLDVCSVKTRSWYGLWSVYQCTCGCGSTSFGDTSHLVKIRNSTVSYSLCTSVPFSLAYIIVRMSSIHIYH